MDEMFYNQNLCVITYNAVRKAMDGEPFTMSLASEAEIETVMDTVNQGIDALLEACSFKGRDSYEFSGRRLECSISTDSLPVLLRRLSEDGAEGISLVSSILTSLGFNDAGEFVGREALGLE